MDEIKDEIQIRRLKERLWKTDPSEYTYNAFYQQRCFVNNIIRSAQRDLFSQLLEENKANYKALYQICNKLLFHNESMPLPPDEP